MTHSDFCREPSIPLVILGQTLLLEPHVAPDKTCSYRSEQKEFFIPVTGGSIRVRGRFVLKAVHSKGWNDK